MKDLSLAMLLVMLTVQVNVEPERLWMNCDSPWYTHFTYIFCHAGWMHLIINAYALLHLVFICHASWRNMSVAWVISFLLPYTGEMPVVGMSTLIYALLGLVIVDSPKWITLIAINAAIILSSVFIPHIAVIPHLVCFASGIIIGYLTSVRHGRDSRTD